MGGMFCAAFGLVFQGEEDFPELGFGGVRKVEAVEHLAADGVGVVEVFADGFQRLQNFVLGLPAGFGLGLNVGVHGFAGFAQEVEEVRLDALVVVLATAAEAEFAGRFNDVVMAEDVGGGEFFFAGVALRVGEVGVGLPEGFEVFLASAGFGALEIVGGLGELAEAAFLEWGEHIRIW